jgi:type I restriction enzyme, S subunit
MIWPAAKLHDICRPKQWPTIAIKDLKEEGYPVYGANGLIGFFDKYTHENPTILITCRGATCGTINLCQARSYVTGNSMALDHLDEKRVLREFLYHFLRKRRLNDVISGSAQPQITREGLTKIEIPLPPLTEQRRIAAILDAAETLREKRRQSLAKLDTLTQSIFLEMFGDPVANPKKWAQKTIGEIGRVITGNTPSRAKPEYYGNGIEWIKSDNLNTSQHYTTKAEEMLSKEGKLVARTVPAGSILVTCIAGSPSCIGNAAITDREVAFNQQINALVPKQADFRFLFAHIVVGKRLIQEASTAGMKGMVSKFRFEKIRLMYPPFDLQRPFAAVFDKIEDLKAAQRSSLEKLDELFSSLQHRAFQGEL